MAGESPVFNCGEFKPIRFQPQNNPGGGGGSIIIYTPTGTVDPWLPQEPESWACICTGELSQLGGCDRPESRRCVRIQEAGSFPRSAATYGSQSECEANAFANFPCALSLFECVSSQRQCTPPLYGIIIDRRCVELPPVENRPVILPPDFYRTAVECAVNCRGSQDCRPFNDPFPPTAGTAIPGGTEQPKLGYKCIPISVQPCPEAPSVEIQIRACVQCLYDGSDPNCIYNLLQTCQRDCQSDRCQYKCVPYERTDCPTPPYTVTGTICQPCKYDPYDPTTATCNKPAGCNESCIPARCADIPVTGVLIEPTNTPPTRFRGVEIKGVRYCRECTQRESNLGQCPYSSLQQCINNYLLTNPQPFDPVIPVYPTGVDAVTIDLGLNQADAVATERFATEKSQETNIYDPVYNFFNKTPKQKTNYVENSFKLNIFNNYVAEEIYKLLSLFSRGYTFWNEELFLNITLAKIAISLNPKLLKAINYIHSVDNTKINPNDIYQTIKRLLISNKLDEFDSNFYINLAGKQSQDSVVQYKFTASKNVQERAGLGILAEGSISADPDDYTDQNKFRLLRQKRLNTDINTTISITTSSDFELPLADAGLAIYQQDASAVSNYIPLATTDYYYVNYIDSNDTSGKIELNTEIERALYVPEAIRYAALKAFRVDPNYSLIASSQPNNHEFVESYDLSGDVNVMYFALDLSSIQDLEKENPLVDKIKATYKLLTDNNEIQEHAYNYGYTVSRLNVDYRDPFVYYIRDTEQFDFIQNDITFRYFNLNISGTLNKTSILTRSLPFGIVVVPGCGSTHNPFHGKTRITKFVGTTVERTYYGQATIDTYRNKPQTFEILSSVTTEAIEVNLPKDYYGYANKFYYTYSPEIFKNTYFYKGTYTSFEPTELPRNKPITSFLITLVDNLKLAYDPLELKWFDVYSRFTPTQIGELLCEGTKDIFKEIEFGWREIPVKPVLRTTKEIKSYIDPTIIPEVDIPQPIITKENRFNAINY